MMNRGLRIKRERKRKSDDEKDGGESFWTICPYCYYLFEYEIVYLDCCLRCQSCQRAFHGVAIKGPLPKVTVVEGKELYNVSLGLFKVCYSNEEVAAVDYKETTVDVDNKPTEGYETEDHIDVDAGSSNIQRRRVIANHEGTSTHLNIKEFCEQLKEKLGTIDEDDRAKQEINQPQSRSCEELSNVQVVGTGETIRTGIENRRGSMADHLENGLNLEYEPEKAFDQSGEMEFNMDNDDIYVDLAELGCWNLEGTE